MHSYLGNPIAASLVAMQETDEVLRKSFTNNAATTVTLAFTLMQLQGGTTDDQGQTIVKGWMELLEDQRAKYLTETLSPLPEDAAAAKVDQAKYEQMSMDSDQQTSSWQSMIQSTRSQVDQTSNARESNLSLVGFTMSSQKYGEDLLGKLNN